MYKLCNAKTDQQELFNEMSSITLVCYLLYKKKRIVKAVTADMYNSACVYILRKIEMCASVVLATTYLQFNAP